MAGVALVLSSPVHADEELRVVGELMARTEFDSNFCHVMLMLCISTVYAVCAVSVCLSVEMNIDNLDIS